MLSPRCVSNTCTLKWFLWQTGVSFYARISHTAVRDDTTSAVLSLKQKLHYQRLIEIAVGRHSTGRDPQRLLNTLRQIVVTLRRCCGWLSVVACIVALTNTTAENDNQGRCMSGGLV